VLAGLEMSYILAGHQLWTVISAFFRSPEKGKQSTVRPIPEHPILSDPINKVDL
jgi:hypothetical protein